MADSQFFTQQASITDATAMKTSFVTSKLRLTKAPFTPVPTSPKTDLVANECDFDGYTPTTGYAIAAVTGPLAFSGGGAVLTTPLVNVVYGPAGTPPVGNSVSGWWIESTGGDVLVAGSFGPPRPCANVGDGFPLVVQLVLFRNGTIGG